MKLKICCAWWGLDQLAPRGMLSKIKDAGFDGVGTGIPSDESGKAELRGRLDEFGLEIVAHQYLEAYESESYGANLRASLENAARFNPLLINFIQEKTGGRWRKISGGMG